MFLVAFLFQVRLKNTSQIKIDITDINNKVPEVDALQIDIEIYENATTGDFIRQVVATDLDRDCESIWEYFQRWFQ